MANLSGRRVALYARVSTADQDPEPQLARMREEAGRLGYVVHMERTEIASGRLVRRPLADEIMAAARGHHIHELWVAKVDRWARSVRHLSATVEELHRLGVAFRAADQGLYVRPDDPTSNLILNILSAVAQWEASIISERTKDALRSRKAAGVRLGRPPKKGMPATPPENPRNAPDAPPAEGGSENDRFLAADSGRNSVPSATGASPGAAGAGPTGAVLGDGGSA